MALDRKWLVLLAVGIGTFMSALDGSVVNVILPVLREALQTDIATVEWVVTIYLLVVSGLLLGFGRLGDLRGHKQIYLLGLAGFVLASGLCGLAPSAQWLIGFRALQAIAAAMMYSNSPAILTKTFPPAQRGRALGLLATMAYLGLTAGPSLGGLLAQRLSWRAVFYINVPVGALAIWSGQRAIARDEPEDAQPPFDALGAALFFAGLFALLLALNQGHAWGWSSPALVALLAGSAGALVAFVRVEQRRAHPMLDLSLFGRAAFSGAAGTAVLNYICIYGILFLLPFYLIQARGLGAAHAGLLLTAQPLVMMVAAPISGTLSDRFGTRLLAVAGMSVLAAGLFLLSRLHASTSHAAIAGALAVCGLGTGVFIAPNNSALMGAAPRERQGIAAGVLATARNVGMVLGVGLAGAILTTLLQPKGLVPAVDAGFLVAAACAAAGAGLAAVR